MSTPSISNISQMLANPQTVTDAELDQINALRKQYPYFVAGYYLDAARLQQRTPFSPEIINIMHATNANWLLFHEFLQQVKKSEDRDEHTQLADTPVTEIPEDIIRRVAEEAETATEDDIMAELMHRNKQTSSVDPQTADTHALNSDFLAEEPGMKNSSDLIHENDFGHLEPIEEDELLPPFYEAANEEQKVAHTQDPNDNTTADTASMAHEERNQSDIEATIEEAQEIYEQDLPAEELAPQAKGEQKDNLIKPIYTEDYFRHEGVEISNDLPTAGELNEEDTEEDKSLMVMMSFAEWLNYYKTKSKAQKEEDDDRKALKTMWQKEKLKAALEEENDEIPEQVFEMAVNSITQDDGLASESIAEIYVKQGKYDKAIDMYRKLSLRNPQKNAYFARKIEEVLKEKQS